MDLNDEDDIENQFSDLVVNLNQVSDELFDSLLATNNINYKPTRSRTCLEDGSHLQATPQRNGSRRISMSPHNLITRNSKSRTSLQTDSQKRRSVNVQTNNKCSSSSSKAPLIDISSRPNTTDCYRSKPRTIEKHATTGFISQKTQEYQSFDSGPFSTNSTQTHLTPPMSSLKKYSSFKLVQKETNRPYSVENAANDCSFKSCLTEKQNESINISPSSSPFHNITFRNKSSQKKENCVVLDPITETENNSLTSTFSIVSALNSSSMPASFVTVPKSPSQHYNLLKTPVSRCSLSSLKTPYKSHLLKTPVSSCSLSSLKTPYKSHLKDRTIAGSSNKTPTNKTPTPRMSYKIVERPRPLIGVKIVPISNSKRISLQLHETKPVSKRISFNKDTSLVEDDDMPCTQPISEIILRGVVAYVEIRADKEYRNEGVKAELASLGARVEKNFTKKVTHCFFSDGRMSTYKRAIDWKVPLVCVLWIEACKAELRQVPLKGYEPHNLEKFKEALPLYRPRTRIRRPATDSKVLAELRKPTASASKTVAAIKTRPPPLGPPSQTDELIEALHGVAGDLRKATHQFEKILTSPILQKRGPKTKPTSPSVSGKENSEEIFEEKKKKRNKKLIFVSSSEEDNNVVETQNKLSDDKSSMIEDSNNEIRVSYDSDDLLVYAKKQAANTRCSAPARLLTSRKCKKLLTSCQKAMEKKIDNTNSTGLNPVTVSNTIENSKRNSRNLQEMGKKSAGDNKVDKDVPKPKKRKLMVPSQVLAAFEQDSNESFSETLDVTCPYKASSNKKHKTGKLTKPPPVAPVLSDWESDDSLARAARRESSALFVKKEKKNQGNRLPPTIVCTSLSKSDTEVVATIAATLGRFAVEAVVSERTTHVVTSSCRRTINLLKGVARGCWVLNVKWVYESLEAGKWLHEERFELTAFSPAVRQSRLERQAFGPEFSLELFSGVGPLYVCRTTLPPPPDLTELLRLCGGTVVSSARAARIVVGSARPLLSPGFNTRRPLVVSERWVLDSVTRLALLNPQDYAVNEPET